MKTTPGGGVIPKEWERTEPFCHRKNCRISFTDCSMVVTDRVGLKRSTKEIKKEPDPKKIHWKRHRVRHPARRQLVWPSSVLVTTWLKGEATRFRQLLTTSDKSRLASDKLPCNSSSSLFHLTRGHGDCHGGCTGSAYHTWYYGIIPILWSASAFCEKARSCERFWLLGIRAPLHHSTPLVLCPVSSHFPFQSFTHHQPIDPILSK
jgi:hypothetical protein